MARLSVMKLYRNLSFNSLRQIRPYTNFSRYNLVYSSSTFSVLTNPWRSNIRLRELLMKENKKSTLDAYNLNHAVFIILQSEKKKDIVQCQDAGIDIFCCMLFSIFTSLSWFLCWWSISSRVHNKLGSQYLGTDIIYNKLSKIACLLILKWYRK